MQARLPVFTKLAGCKSSAATSPLSDILKYGPLSRSDPCAVFKLETAICSLATKLRVHEQNSCEEPKWIWYFAYMQVGRASAWYYHNSHIIKKHMRTAINQELFTSDCLCIRGLGSITVMYSVKARTHLHQTFFCFNSLTRWTQDCLAVFWHHRVSTMLSQFLRQLSFDVPDTVSCYAFKEPKMTSMLCHCQHHIWVCTVCIKH